MSVNDHTDDDIDGAVTGVTWFANQRPVGGTLSIKPLGEAVQLEAKGSEGASPSDA